MLKKLLRHQETTLYLFSGKGGVGKTSVAAATAMYFASQGKKTLVVSIDPAHSLGDSFGVKIGGEEKKLSDNLYAVEIDSQKAVDEYKEKFNMFTENMEMLQGFGDFFDVGGMTPGIDEIAAFDKFMKYMQNKDYDVIIFDTAPTGHTLRFLSLPDVMDSWIGKLIKIKMKFSGMFDMFSKILPFKNKEGEEKKINPQQLEEMKQRIEEAKSVLTDPKRTHYNIVTIAETMSIAESERSLEVLKEYKIPVKSVVINNIVPENSGCGFCSGRRKNQLEKISEIEKKFKDYKILKVQQFKTEVHGKEMLEQVGKELYG